MSVDPKEQGDLGSSLDQLKDRIRKLQESETVRVQELAREQVYLDALFESAQEGIVLADNDGKVRRVNGEFTKIFGFTPTEAMGQPVDELVAATAERSEAAGVTEKVARGERITFDAKRRRKDGTSFPVSVIASPIVLEGVQVGVYGIYRDITERIRTEEALKAEKAHLEQLFESAQEGIVLADNDGKVRRVNREFTKIFGYTQADAEGLFVDELVARPEDMTAAVDVTRKAAAGEAVSMETVRRHRDGNPVDVSILASPITSGENQVGVYAIYRDIRDRKKAEKALSRIASLPEQNPHPVIETDLGGKVTYLNPSAFERFPGLDDRGPDHDILKGFSEILEQLQGNEGQPLVRKVGVEDSVFEQTFLLVPDARLVRIFAFDVTENAKALEEKQQLQSQLLQSQKMEAVGILAGGIAHDFNNILTGILGQIDLAMHRLEPDHSSRRHMRSARKSSMRAAALTRQLLLFSRQEPMKMEPLDLDEIIMGLFEMLVRLIGEDIEVKLDLSPDLWAVNADRGTMEQVITNLVINARDAMPEGGTLSIRTDNVLLDESAGREHPDARAGDFVQMSVTDSGLGMDPETLEHIFEPFFTTKGPTHGTGLGLPVVYGIVQEHGGWIRIASKPREGTTFRILLPGLFEVKPKGRITEPISLGSKEGGGKRILLVEDEDAVRGLAMEALGSANYEVTSVPTAGKALESFDEAGGSFDLVFTDVVLPDVNGIELAEKLLKKRPDLPVLLTSGYTERKSQLTDIKERGLPFLQKPYRLAELLKAVHEAIEGPRGE
ncbi:MAG: PAS domain S-box protein [Planctomycetota bacterium]